MLNNLIEKQDMVVLCQYAREDFLAELLIAAVETHPLLVYDHHVCANHYYVPPEEYLKPGFSDLKLRRMLVNIVSRERLMQRFLSKGGPAATQ